MDTIAILFGFFERILPALILVALFGVAIRPDAKLRIVVYISTFIILRDVMTPLGLWSLGREDGLLWIRLSDDPSFLLFFGLSSLAQMASLAYLDRENRAYLVWLRGDRIKGIISGVLGSCLVVLPLFIAYRNTDVSLRGGVVSSSLLLPILVFALLGNFFEEGLFRGYVLGYLRERHTIWKAGVLSGIAFAFCHIFLATTVTNMGTPLLLFTLWEGIIAGLIGAKYGIIPATLTHGGAIFLLSSGLI